MGTLKMIFSLGWRSHRAALLELLTVTLISTSPLLIGAMIRWIQIENEQLSLASYSAALNTFLTRGELFLYALAFIAVVAWMALREWPLGLRPPRVALGLFCILSYGIICTFYSLDTAKVAVHVNVVLLLSKVMFAATLTIYYLATLLSKIEVPDLGAILAASSSALAAELDRDRTDG